MPSVKYTELSGTMWDLSFDDPSGGYYGSMRSSFGSFSRVYGVVGTFGTIHNFPSTPGGTTGTVFATLTSDYIYSTHIRYGSFYGNYGSSARLYGVVGTFGSIHNYPNSSATFSGAYIYGTRLRSATTVGDYGSWSRAYSPVGTFGSIHNYPTYTLPATVTADYIFGTRTQAATVAGALGDFDYLKMDDGLFITGTSLTFVGNRFYAGTLAGSSQARTIYNSFSHATAVNSDAVQKYFTAFDAAGPHNVVFVPFIKYGGENYLYFVGYHNTTMSISGVSYYLAVGTLSPVGTYIEASASGYIKAKLDISSYGNDTLAIATVYINRADGDDYGTLSNVVIDILTR